MRQLGIIAFELLTLRKFNARYPTSPDPHSRLSKKCRALLTRMIFCRNKENQRGIQLDNDEFQPFTTFEDLLVAPLMGRISHQLFIDIPVLTRLHPNFSKIIIAPTLPVLRGRSSIIRQITTNDSNEFINEQFKKQKFKSSDETQNIEETATNMIFQNFNNIPHCDNQKLHLFESSDNFRIDSDDSLHQFMGESPYGHQSIQHDVHDIRFRNPVSINQTKKNNSCTFDKVQYEMALPVIQQSGIQSIPIYYCHCNICHPNILEYHQKYVNQQHYRSPKEIYRKQTNHEIPVLLQHHNGITSNPTHCGHSNPTSNNPFQSSPIQPCPKATPLLPHRSFEVKPVATNSFDVQLHRGFFDNEPNQNIQQTESHQTYPPSQQQCTTSIRPNESLSIIVKSPSMSFRVTTSRSEEETNHEMKQEEAKTGNEIIDEINEFKYEKDGEVVQQENKSTHGRSGSRPAVDRPTVASRIRSDEVSREYQWLRDRSIGRNLKRSKTCERITKLSKEEFMNRKESVNYQQQSGRVNKIDMLKNDQLLKREDDLKKERQFIYELNKNPKIFHYCFSEIKKNNKNSNENKKIEDQLQRRKSLGDSLHSFLAAAPISIVNLPFDEPGVKKTIRENERGKSPNRRRSISRLKNRCKTQNDHLLQSTSTCTKLLNRHVSFSPKPTNQLSFNIDTEQEYKVSNELWSNERLPEIPSAHISPESIVTTFTQSPTTTPGQTLSTLNTNNTVENISNLQKGDEEADVDQFETLAEIFSMHSNNSKTSTNANLSHDYSNHQNDYFNFVAYCNAAKNETESDLLSSSQ